MTESSDSSFVISATLKKIVKDGALLSLFEDGSYSELIGVTGKKECFIIG